jgi:hypothetical protein
MAADDATYAAELASYIKGLKPKQQCEFVVLVSKYLYLRDKGDVPPPLTGLDAPFRTGKYRAVVVNQTIDGILKEVSIRDALSNLMSVCTDEKRAGMVDKKIAALSAKEPYPTMDEFKAVFGDLTPVPVAKAPAKDPFSNWETLFAVSTNTKPSAAPKKLPNWDPFATPVFPTNTKPSIASAAAKVPLPAPASPNLFPGTDFSSLRTLQGLNDFIAGRYSGKMGDEARLTVSAGRTIGSYMTDFKDYTFSQYECMHSEGSNSDCLIHSFLTATCPAFRRLTSRKTGGGTDKNDFATWFRHYVYPSLPNVQAKLADTSPDPLRDSKGKIIKQRTVGEVARHRIFTPSIFLADQDVGLLCNAYGVNILSFEGQEGLQTMRINGSDIRDPSRPVYMISNSVGVHFEAVRTPEGSYTIPARIALTINLIVQGKMINDSFELMRDTASIREGVRHYGIELPIGGNTQSLKGAIAAQIQRAKESMRIPRAAPLTAANAAKNTREEYIQKRLKNPENGEMFLAAGVPEEDLKRDFGEAWNAARAAQFAGKGGSRRVRKRSLRAKRRHTSKGHGKRKH